MPPHRQSKGMLSSYSVQLSSCYVATPNPCTVTSYPAKLKLSRSLTSPWNCFFGQQLQSQLLNLNDQPYKTFPIPLLSPSPNGRQAPASLSGRHIGHFQGAQRHVLDNIPKRASQPLPEPAHAPTDSHHIHTRRRAAPRSPRAKGAPVSQPIPSPAARNRLPARRHCGARQERRDRARRPADTARR